MPRRAERLLAAGLVAALCGCASLQEPRLATPPESQHPPAPAVTPAAPAETTALPAEESALLQPPAHPVPEVPATQTLDLLREAEQFAGLPPDARQRALADSELRYSLEQTPLTLVRYSLLLSVSEPDRQGSANAAARLRDLLDAHQGAADGELEALARLLMHVLDEREHLLAQNTELQRKLNQLKAIEQQLGDRDSTDAPQIAP